MGWGIIIALVVSIIAAVVLYKIVKNVITLVLNGLIGIAVFIILNFLGIANIPINLWTFLIAAIGGIFGIVVVIVLTFLGITL